MRTLHLPVPAPWRCRAAQPINHWPTSNARLEVFQPPRRMACWCGCPLFQLDIINGLLFTEVTSTLGNDTLLGGQQYTAVVPGPGQPVRERTGRPGGITTVNYPPQGRCSGRFPEMGQGRCTSGTCRDRASTCCMTSTCRVGDPADQFRVPEAQRHGGVHPRCCSAGARAAASTCRGRPPGACSWWAGLQPRPHRDHRPGFDISDASDSARMATRCSSTPAPPAVRHGPPTRAEMQDASGLSQVPEPF